ncbi:hypothetical protein C8J57DRAFT_1284427 [Mycena rebaudengoi]|nr:hypothetical protein C8J57DRAFT_1284427 [Mycena rebaudengoi]
MASPKAIIQILITSTRILGKALAVAGRQAVKNAKQAPQALNEVSGVGNANTTSMTDQLTRQHRMTLDEAHLILNVKNGEQMQRILENYEHLFKANSPPAKPPAGPPGKQPSIITHSHYLQSKVVRARERIEAEFPSAKSPPPPPGPERQTPPPSESPAGPP